MRHAFSLVELSIVLVILGLLTGGVLAGKSLVRAAKLRSVANDYSRYVTATYAFRDKYLALPGDMTNASSFWGAQDSGDGLGTDCTNTVSTSTLTCNGNGDGLIGGELTTDVNDRTTWYERFRAWQHLANAGMIEGTYKGVQLWGSNAHGDKTTQPASRISSVIGYAYYATYFNITWAAFFSNVPGSTVIVFGGFGTASTDPGATTSTGPALTPTEAWNIDTKLDDGKPGYGKMQATKGIAAGDAWSGCTTTTVASTAAYGLSTDDVLCALYLRL